MDIVENIVQREFFNPDTFRMVLVITGTFRNHQLGVKMEIADEVWRSEHYKECAKRVLMEELEFQAEKLRPTTVERRVQEEFDEELWDRNRPLFAEMFRKKQEEKVQVNWLKEGF